MSRFRHNGHMFGDLRQRLGHDLRASLHIDRTALHPASAIRAALVTTAVTVVGMVMQSPVAAIGMAIGALNVYLTEGNAPLGRRARVMLWASAWLSLATLLGGLVSPSIAALLFITPVVAWVSGFIGAAGSRAALVGVMSLVLFTIAGGNATTLTESFAAAAYVLVGAFVQTAISLMLSVFARQPWDIDTTPALRDRLATHLGIQDDFMRHGLRLALALTIATALSQVWDFEHSYWIPMTVAWMSRPDADGTVTRVSGRLLGTFIGLALIALTFQVTSATNAAIVILIGLSAFVAALFIFANYAIAVIGITILVVTLFALDNDPVQETAPVRMVATLIAAAIVLPVSLLGRKRG